MNDIYVPQRVINRIKKWCPCGGTIMFTGEYLPVGVVLSRFGGDSANGYEVFHKECLGLR